MLMNRKKILLIQESVNFSKIRFRTFDEDRNFQPFGTDNEIETLSVRLIIEVNWMTIKIYGRE